MDLKLFGSDDEQSTSVISDTDLDKNFEKEYANYLKINFKNQNFLEFCQIQSRNFPIFSASEIVFSNNSHKRSK